MIHDKDAQALHFLFENFAQLNSVCKEVKIETNPRHSSWCLKCWQNDIPSIIALKYWGTKIYLYIPWNWLNSTAINRQHFVFSTVSKNISSKPLATCFLPYHTPLPHLSITPSLHLLGFKPLKRIKHAVIALADDRKPFLPYCALAITPSLRELRRVVPLWCRNRKRVD
jgi:hypothetical protein